MFTGIIEELGSVAGISRDGIEVASALEDIKKGDSVSVCGVCLTVTSISAKSGKTARLQFDVSPETYSRTNLNELKKGSRVNLERALKMSGRLGGHIVSGHIDALGSVGSVKKQSKFELWEFIYPAELSKYIAEKGSVAVDGISLTVAGVKSGSFTAAVVPFTLNNTTIGLKKTGSAVNIEVDILAKYVETIFSKKGVTLDSLKKAGFL